jgi:hypothetical protein
MPIDGLCLASACLTTRNLRAYRAHGCRPTLRRGASVPNPKWRIACLPTCEDAKFRSHDVHGQRFGVTVKAKGMAVPDFQSLMLPVLEATANGEISAADLRNKVASHLGLSSDDLAAKLPSGRQTTFANRTGWANQFLQRAGLIEKIGRGRYRATETGVKTLAEHPQKIDMAFLQRFPSYIQWRQSSAVPSGPTKDEGEALGADALSTPEEQIATSYKTLNSAIEAELLDRIRGMSPAFFETLIIDLLIKPAAAVVSRKWGRRSGNPATAASMA